MGTRPSPLEGPTRTTPIGARALTPSNKARLAKRKFKAAPELVARTVLAAKTTRHHSSLHRIKAERRRHDAELHARVDDPHNTLPMSCKQRTSSRTETTQKLIDDAVAADETQNSSRDSATARNPGAMGKNQSQLALA